MPHIIDCEACGAEMERGMEVSAREATVTITCTLGASMISFFTCSRFLRRDAEASFGSL